MKKVILILLLVITAQLLFAKILSPESKNLIKSNRSYSQDSSNCDLIFMRNGDTIFAKVTEINPDFVHYRSCKVKDSPVIVELCTNILMIKFSNGVKKVFGEPAIKETQKTQDVQKENSILNTNKNQSNEIYVVQDNGIIFMQNGKRLTIQQLLEITSADKVAYTEMRIAKSNSNAGSFFSAVGGSGLGASAASLLINGKVNLIVVGIAIVSVGVSIMFAHDFKIHAKNAVRIYNENLGPPNNTPLNISSDPQKAIHSNDNTSESSNLKHSIDLLSVLYCTKSDSSYQNYMVRLESLLKQDIKINSHEFHEYKYMNGKIKCRGFKASHKYGGNEDYFFKIGTWEYYTTEGVLEKTVNYNLREHIVAEMK
jgi:hypothetical protein